MPRCEHGLTTGCRLPCACAVSIVEKARFLQQPYYPIIWMPGRHVQTIAGAIFADLSWMFRRPVVYEREGVRAWDGSELHLDWYSEGIVAIVWRSRGAMWGGALRARAQTQRSLCFCCLLSCTSFKVHKR